MCDDVIRFTCPACGKRLKAPRAAAGRAATCRRCGAAVTVPESIDALTDRVALLGLVPDEPADDGRDDDGRDDDGRDARCTGVRPLLARKQTQNLACAYILLLALLWASAWLLGLYEDYAGPLHLMDRVAGLVRQVVNAR